MLWILLAMPVLLLAGLCALMLLVRGGGNPVPKKADVIIVLGARSAGGKPGKTLQSRLALAAECYGALFAPGVLVTGGCRAKESESEAALMKRELIALGVPADQIITEERAKDTFENLVFCMDIMRKNGARSALIITSDYHMYRALLFARTLGMNASGAAASTNGRAWPLWLREAPGLVKYAMLRWVFKREYFC